jgi:hypothetical protein
MLSRKERVKELADSISKIGLQSPVVVRTAVYGTPGWASVRRCQGRLMSESGLGRVKTFSCKRSELDEVATRAIFPDFDYALIAAISG